MQIVLFLRFNYFYVNPLSFKGRSHFLIARAASRCQEEHVSLGIGRFVGKGGSSLTRERIDFAKSLI